MALTKILLTSVLSMLLAGTAFAQVGNNTSLLNPNLAGREELVALPQLDEARVDAILDERPFLDMSELHVLLSRSLSEAQLTALYAQLFIPINLNTATREAILSIPSVGDRLAREFEEYRPYKAIAQFRRELGKYVSDAEVARMGAVCLRAAELEHGDAGGPPDHPRCGKSTAAGVLGVPALYQHATVPPGNRQVRERRGNHPARALRHA